MVSGSVNGGLRSIAESWARRETSLREGTGSALQRWCYDDFDNRQVWCRLTQFLICYYRRFAISRCVKQIMFRCDANETEGRNRCCKLFERVTHGHRHLKSALSWNIAKKLPDLPVSGYVCRKCRREFHKVPTSRDRLSVASMLWENSVL